MFEYFIYFCLFGYLILVLTGLGILTKAVFNISSGTTMGSVANQSVLDYINIKPLATNYSAVDKANEIAAVPKITIPQSNNDTLINLSGTDFMVSKIALISVWILIIIETLFLVFGMFGNN